MWKKTPPPPKSVGLYQDYIYGLTHLSLSFYIAKHEGSLILALALFCLS